MPPPSSDSEPSPRSVSLWLLELLEDSPPRLVREIQEEAQTRGIAIGRLRTAAQALPLIRKPQVLRGPWTWQLPQPEELVQVSFTCPVAGCGNTSEGWMEFGPSRFLYMAGLIRYLTRGTLRRTLPAGSRNVFLQLSLSSK